MILIFPARAGAAPRRRPQRPARKAAARPRHPRPGPACPLRRSAANGGADKPPKKPTHIRKYICPCCKNSVRASKAVNLICGDCMEKMELAD